MVVHVLGKPIKAHMPVFLGLAKLFTGIGQEQARRVCAKVGLHQHMRMNELLELQLLGIAKELNNHTIDKDWVEQIRADIKMKRDIGSYAGMRHAMGLPVRGQRTRNNNATSRKLNKLNRHS